MKCTTWGFRFSIVEPDPGHTKLAVSRSGLNAIARITNPIAVVAVIGPYRSGKSFLLNQLLSLSCNEGFGVGHMRDTKTRGIWAWGEPLEINLDGVKTSVLFLDTEGFESIGKSNVYDDRIFALAAIMSSVLIYNLPETVREADIAKLSFAVDLAEEFYGRVKGRESILEPAKLLWLIQRDFLEGKSVQAMVEEALQTVPNPDNNKDIFQVNRIRKSLSLMAENSTAFSLPQPHLERTKLCEMGDSELHHSYVSQRERLKKVVTSMIRPKIVQGGTITGKDFVSLLEQTLDALNKGEIPSAGYVVEAFNRAVVDRCVALYNTRMSKFQLPVREEELLSGHESTVHEVTSLFGKERFGRQKDNDESSRMLLMQVEKAYVTLVEINTFRSSRQCDNIYTSCEDQLDSLQGLRLPSMAKFSAGITSCNITFTKNCLGPSKPVYQKRLEKMWLKARSHFINNYNQRLFNWLVVLSLVMVVVGRFVIKFLLLEIAAWGLFIFLETYTRIFWSAESLYYNPTWRVVVSAWEATVYGPLLDLDRWFIPLSWIIFFGFITYRLKFGRRKKGPAPLLPSVDIPRTSRRSRFLKM
nr:guanylate-binding protein 4-like isoform X2 [Physcomitrium patens]|eukprot:XP_024360229.1 guanylate-binding protein 4-like isoform X2 [Physcomitrella patens]